MILSQLPVELLSHILSHITSSKTVHSLSLTCRALQVFIQQEGWKVFVRHRFPSLMENVGLDAYSEAAHGLATLSRNWDKKALLAHYIEPPESNLGPARAGRPSRRWQRPTGQTMGFRPSIDSYEEWTGGTWASRADVVAWSTGSGLTVRACRQKKPEWHVWKNPGKAEGRDDIISLKLLRPHQKADLPSSLERILFGTASGELSLLDIDWSKKESNVAQSYATNNRTIRSLAISSSTSPLMIANIDDSIALYPVQCESGDDASLLIDPISEVIAMQDTSKGSRIWSTEFLSDTRVATGLGPSSEPIHIYEVTPSGLSKEPIRKFSEAKNSQASAADQVGSANRRKHSSVYPIIPLPESSHAADLTGQVFLSGWYDGMIRLHDLRSPAQFEMIYYDATEDSPVFSLQAVGRERIAAGVSRHSLVKFWDLRVSGGRAYSYVDASPVGDAASKSSNVYTNERPSGTANPRGWNLFLHPRNEDRQIRYRTTDSPVYSISCPSPHSPSVYFGVENNVVQLDFVSILDPHPDPVFEPSVIKRDKNGKILLKETWNSNNEIFSIAMYEQAVSVDTAVQLKVQDGVFSTKGVFEGYDNRWK